MIQKAIMTMLKFRVLSAIIGVPIVLFIIFLGRIPVGVMVVLISAFALVEFYQPWQSKNIYPSTLIGITFGCLFPIVALFGLARYSDFLLVIMTVLAVVWQMLSKRKTRLGVDAGLTVLGVIFAGLFPSYIIRIVSLENGRLLLLTVILGVWACDIAAYTIGKMIGKHKLAPEISPNKTIEGAVAGFVAGFAVTVSMGLLIQIGIATALTLGLVIGVITQVGDMFASMIKREIGIKDFGASIPGHGGVIDRFDGLFFVVPLAFYLLVL